MNAAFYLLNNLHLYFSGKTCAANVDRQNMPLSRILQGNWNQKRVNPTAACIILLWKAGKFQRLMMKADEREQNPGLNVRQGPAPNSGGDHHEMFPYRFPYISPWNVPLGWAALHTAEGSALSLPWPAPFRDNTPELLLDKRQIPWFWNLLP